MSKKEKELMIASIEEKIEQSIKDKSNKLFLYKRDYESVDRFLFKAVLMHFNQHMDHAVIEYPGSLIEIQISYYHPLVMVYHGAEIGEKVNQVKAHLAACKQQKKRTISLHLQEYSLNVFVHKAIISYLQTEDYSFKIQKDDTLSVKLR